MNKFKKILSLLLAVLMLASVTCLCLASCGDNGEDPTPAPDGGEENPPAPPPSGTPYTVTVVDGSGAPVTGAVVKLNVNGVDTPTATTNQQGKATVYVTDEMIIVAFADLVSVPEGYAKGSVTNVDITNATSCTFNVTKIEKQTYTARVVDQNGDAVEGVDIQLCFGLDSCQRPKKTDANGEYTVECLPGEDAHFKINSVPAGYTYEGGEVDLADGVYEATIVITKN